MVAVRAFLDCSTEDVAMLLRLAFGTFAAVLAALALSEPCVRWFHGLLASRWGGARWGMGQRWRLRPSRGSQLMLQWLHQQHYLPLPVPFPCWHCSPCLPVKQQALTLPLSVPWAAFPGAQTPSCPRATLQT